jgi:hypothetical protein
VVGQGGVQRRGPTDVRACSGASGDFRRVLACTAGFCGDVGHAGLARRLQKQQGAVVPGGHGRGQVSVAASPCLTPAMEGGQRGMVREWLGTADDHRQQGLGQRPL